MVQSKNSERIFFLCADPDSSDYRNRIEWVKTEAKNEGDAEKLEYNLALLNLLSHCCAGLVLFSEMKVQQMYPIDWLLAALLDSRLPLKIKNPLLSVYFHAILDSEVKLARM
eukprot:CAMPEP_0175125676 /NCGR_PEP_ID=MMETSP0087-20121206/3440_1 /TAXON_ID=136419 /ORGANISM="Unknown Unknown, Strain D1" /LENGTH=111 /DNA_ID=CAMNT_0016407523 /DNA_START=174 /DNA_END=509 /DNA_ORIENTATION=-